MKVGPPGWNRAAVTRQSWTTLWGLANGGAFSGGPVPVLGRFVMQAAWQNGSNSRNFVNGAFVGSVLGTGTGPGTVGLGTGGTYAEPLDGDLAEVIAYDSALSEANMAGVWQYLAAKYQLS